jgi:hypothetical protein
MRQLRKVQVRTRSPPPVASKAALSWIPFSRVRFIAVRFHLGGSSTFSFYLLSSLKSHLRTDVRQRLRGVRPALGHANRDDYIILRNTQVHTVYIYLSCNVTTTVLDS